MILYDLILAVRTLQGRNPAGCLPEDFSTEGWLAIWHPYERVPGFRGHSSALSALFYLLQGLR